MTHWIRAGRLGVAGAFTLLACTVAHQVSASTFSDYTGTLNAFATAGNTSNQSIPIAGSAPDNYGSYSLTANASAPPGAGFFVTAQGDASADLEAESLFLSLSGSGSLGAARGVQVLGSGSSTTDFSILAPTSVDLTLNAGGLYSVLLTAMGSATPLYSLDQRNVSPGSTFAGTIPLTLQPGTYELSAYGSNYAPQSGVINGGGIRVQLAPVPIPAAGWLLGSGLMFLGTLTRRRRHQDGALT
jgi:hypothetical protein